MLLGTSSLQATQHIAREASAKRASIGITVRALVEESRALS